MLKERAFEPLSGPGTGWRSITCAWGWRITSERSCSRTSAARLEAVLSSSGFAAVETVMPWAAEQVGAQAHVHATTAVEGLGGRLDLVEQFVGVSVEWCCVDGEFDGPVLDRRRRGILAG